MSPNPSPILDVAKQLGIRREHLVPYGDDKAKVRLEAGATDRAPGRLILVSAITPTSAGEGKTTISIGLAQGLAKIGKHACLALREPSLGPTFGLKGGATGGGASIVIPAADINLHFTGDFHAIGAAHNLLAAMLDNHLQQGNPLRIDSRRVLWRRVIDMNDRALRRVVIGLGGAAEGVPRETGFDITPASEVMAVLCLSKDMDDLRQRLGRMIVALDQDKLPVTAADLKAIGSMVVLLRDALLPNLVQTVEGVPAFVHGGPFANIAHGCNSVIATTMALSHADWLVTEAGFGADLGAEKFFDIKCQTAGLNPSAAVLVATVRALKRHGGVLKGDLAASDPAAVERGIANLEKQVENLNLFGKPVVVALNRFATDSPEELEVVRRACGRLGVPCAEAEVFQKGGEGGRALAEAVVAAAESRPATPLVPLYDREAPLKSKIETIATKLYGASGVDYAVAAERDLAQVEKLGYAGLPICMAKTPTSLSDDPTVVGRPRDYRITVRSAVLSAGAGFVVPLAGEIIRMPGLPSVPQAEQMDLVDGKVIGLLGG
ncbi:MAG: formate--tetrahydrofolate ligase [Vicinamibacteria bacterium]